jgi:hypothetical protein
MDVVLIFIAAAAFLVLLVAGLGAAVLFLVLRRPPGRRYDPDDAPSPLERARAAASALTAAEWEDFRRWVEDQRPRPTSGGEGITR